MARSCAPTYLPQGFSPDRCLPVSPALRGARTRPSSAGGTLVTTAHIIGETNDKEIIAVTAVVFGGDVLLIVTLAPDIVVIATADAGRFGVA
jgi:hypothetical protein